MLTLNMNGLQVFETNLVAVSVESIRFITNGGRVAIDNILITTIPEPSTALLMGAGLGFLSRRRRTG